MLRFAFIALGILLLVSCKKEDAQDVSGRFTENRSCTVIMPPASVGLDTFYTHYLNCSGIAVVSPDAVPVEALYAADSIISFMLDGLEPVRDELMRQGVYHVLYPLNTTPNDMPERQGEPHAYGPGSFLLHKKVSITSQANMQCLPEPDNRSGMDSELVHEFGHSLHELGLAIIYPEFNNELGSAYNNAMAEGLWDNTVLASNAPHYFVEGMQIWYGVNKPGPMGGNGSSNHIANREQLRLYDPRLYTLLNSYLNKREDIPVCFK